MINLQSLIWDTLLDATGENNNLYVSIEKEYDRVRLSAGITPKVFVLLPSTIESVMPSELIYKASIEFVILGNFHPCSVFVIIFYQILLNLQILFL